jgi:hypothetical protein
MVQSAKGVAWSMIGLVLLMMLAFFVIHMASAAPVVGGAAAWTGSHASGAAYGY